MSRKFHINANGVPAPCRARQGNCPYGGADGTENHYDTEREAQLAADKLNAEKYDLLPQRSGINHLGRNEQAMRDKIDELDEEEYLVDSDNFMEFIEKNYDGRNIKSVLGGPGADAGTKMLIHGNFMHNHGERIAARESLKFFEDNTTIFDNLRERIKKEDSSYRYMVENEPYEHAYEDWTSEHLNSKHDLKKALIQSEQPGWKDYVTSDFTSKVDDFYKSSGKHPHYFNTRKATVGEKEALREFITDYHQSEVNKGREDHKALDSTVAFFTRNTNYLDRQRERINTDDTYKYTREHEPYELAFEEWKDDNIQSLDDFHRSVFISEDKNNNSKFISKMQQFYSNNGIDKSVRKEIKRNGFFHALNGFVDDYHKESRGKVMLDVLNKYDEERKNSK